MNLRQKLRAILKRDRGEKMFEVRRMPVGSERAPRPFAEYVAMARAREAGA